MPRHYLLSASLTAKKRSSEPHTTAIFDGILTELYEQRLRILSLMSFTIDCECYRWLRLLPVVLIARICLARALNSATTGAQRNKPF